MNIMKYQDLIKNGAKVLDVRSKEEFENGHVEGAINISVNDVQSNMAEIKKMGSPLIICCLSGGRAGLAKALIQAAGIKDVYNAGGWENLL